MGIAFSPSLHLAPSLSSGCRDFEVRPRPLPCRGAHVARGGTLWHAWLQLVHGSEHASIFLEILQTSSRSSSRVIPSLAYGQTGDSSAAGRLGTAAINTFAPPCPGYRRYPRPADTSYFVPRNYKKLCTPDQAGTDDQAACIRTSQTLRTSYLVPRSIYLRSYADTPADASYDHTSTQDIAD